MEQPVDPRGDESDDGAVELLDRQPQVGVAVWAGLPTHVGIDAPASAHAHVDFVVLEVIEEFQQGGVGHHVGGHVASVDPGWGVSVGSSRRTRPRNYPHGGQCRHRRNPAMSCGSGHQLRQLTP